MDNFIEQNKRLLSFYCWAAKIGGWLFLTISFLAVFGHSVALVSRLGDANEFSRYWQHNVPWGMVNNVLPTGLLALGISQFIWFLLEKELKAPWLLRHAHQLLYLYTAILTAYYCWAGAIDVQSHIDEPYDFPWRMILLVIFILVKILALVGLAELLRRLLPVIEESRTLV